MVPHHLKISSSQAHLTLGWFPFSNFSAFTSPEMNELYLNWKLGIDKRYRISRCLFVVCSVCRPLNCRLDMWGSPPASKFGWTLIRDIWYLGGLSLARKSVCDVIADLTRWVYPPVWAHPHQAATQRWGWTIGNHNQFKIKMKNCLTIFFQKTNLRLVSHKRLKEGVGNFNWIPQLISPNLVEKLKMCHNWNNNWIPWKLLISRGRL